MTAEEFQEFRYRSGDGLSLYGRIYGEPATGALPFVCLAGLTRNSRDFHEFALAVQAGDHPRPVIAFDYRGRGRSERPPDAETYTVPIEAGDVVAGLAHLGIDRAIFVGTSRGALIIHVLAALRPDLVAAAVLNDAGPRIEAAGLRAIRAYVGRAGDFRDWESATDYVASLHGEAFPALSREDFARMARAAFVETDGRIVADHDQRLAEGFAAIDLDQAIPELWDQFQALAGVPLLVLRGEHSRLLSAETVERMRREHPRMEAIEVPGQGHAPLLETGDLPRRIAGFGAKVEAAEHRDGGSDRPD